LSNFIQNKEGHSRVILVCQIAPDYGGQSGSVLLRHLLRFAESRKVVVCYYHVPPNYKHPFQLVKIPLRKWWFLPAKSRLLRRVNCYQKARYIISKLQLRKKDIIICCVHTDDHLIARYMSNISGSMLISLLHDKWPVGYGESDVAKTLSASKAVMCVSEGLMDLAEKVADCKVVLLPPIGEDPFAPSAADHSYKKKSIGLAGGLTTNALSVAKRFGFPLFVISDDVVIRSFVDNNRCGIAVERTEKNRDALKLLRENCCATFVYIDPIFQDYATYSFPSKLVDFCQIGLPIVICAPESSQLGRWAAKRGWNLWMRLVDDVEEICRIRSILENPILWKREAEIVQELSRNEFSSRRIHLHLENAIQSLPPIK
jgi:hypothetical protein